MKARVAKLLLVALILVLAATPLALAEQQSGKVYRIGFLSGASSEGSKITADQFRKGLRDLGWAEGQNVVIEYRWADGKQDRLPELAASLVRARVDVMVAAASPATSAAHQATRSIPIVSVAVGDPIGLGFAVSLARPGGNVTGLASYLPELVAKIFEVLKEAIPSVKHVATFWNPTNPLHRPGSEELRKAVLPLGIQLQPLRIAAPDDFEEGYRRAVADGATAVYIPGDTMFGSHRARLAELALDARLPTIYTWRGYVDAGGLIAYGPDLPHLYRRAAIYVDKILKGANPADLPIEQPTRFELVINLRTAKALGLTIPPSLLLRADQIIE